MVGCSIELGPGGDRAYGMNLALAELVLGLLAGRPRPDKASQHLPDLNSARPSRNHRIARGEGAQLLFVVGLHDAQTPRAAAVEHGTEDHHLAGLDAGPPMIGMAGHDLPLLVAHVQRECWTGSLEPEYEGAHETRMPSS